MTINRDGHHMLIGEIKTKKTTYEYVTTNYLISSFMSIYILCMPAKIYLSGSVSLYLANAMHILTYVVILGIC